MPSPVVNQMCTVRAVMTYMTLNNMQGAIYYRGVAFRNSKDQTKSYGHRLVDKITKFFKCDLPTSNFKKL